MRMLPGIITLTLLSGCAQEVSQTSATPEGRFALGKAVPYVAQPLSDAERDLVEKSLIIRRQLGWNIAGRVSASFQPHMAGPSTDIRIPAWMSWYGRDDFERIFAKSFTSLSVAARRERADIDRTTFVEVEDWAASQLLHLPNWSQARRDEYLGKLAGTEEWQGAMGLSRTLYSPEALGSLVTDYQSLENCQSDLCTVRKFSSDSVVVKAAWIRRNRGFRLPVYDTDADSMRSRFSEDGKPWDIQDRDRDGTDGNAISIRTQSGATFDLTALHIMTKESVDWIWVTLWWSDSPRSDFGEDRPPYLADSAWHNYKMCVVTNFVETAEDEDELVSRFPSLGSAIQATKDGSGLSWCSNPYLEKGDHNQKSNCIGCHQHAGTNATPEQILLKDHQGRSRERTDFPSDYNWSLSFGAENLGHLVRERVRYHSSHSDQANLRFE